MWSSGSFAPACCSLGSREGSPGPLPGRLDRRTAGASSGDMGLGAVAEGATEPLRRTPIGSASSAVVGTSAGMRVGMLAADAGSARGTVDRSSFFGSADNSELARVKSYGLLNVRAGVTGDWGTNRWTASLWATNLTDEIYTMGGISSAAATLQYAEFPGTPRAIGATLRLDF